MIIKLTSQEACAALEKWLNDDFLRPHNEIVVDSVQWDDGITHDLIIVAHKKKPISMITNKPNEK